MLLYFIDKLKDLGRRLRFPIERNLTGRLIVSGNPHILRWKALEKMQQNLDRVIMRIDRGGQGFPIGFRRANKFRLRCIGRDAATVEFFRKLANSGC